MSDERRLLERMGALAKDVGKGLGADDSARYDMVKAIVGDAEAYSRFGKRELTEWAAGRRCAHRRRNLKGHVDDPFASLLLG